MQGGGASGKENMGGRDVKKFLLGLYHYGIFIPKTYYDVCSMITCCGVWIYLHVRLCDMCLFLDEAIRGNYNATVSTASFASLCSSSCTMRGKQWCFFFSPLNSLSFFYQVSLHGYNEPHHSDTWVQQRESHCRQAIETGEKGNRRRVGWGSVEWWQANRELFFAVFPWLFTIIGGHCEEDSWS